MFRNLTALTFAGFVLPALEELEASLAELPLADPGPLELARAGFVRPYGQGDERLAVPVGDCYVLAVGINARKLPGAAIDKALAEKLDAIEKETGQRPGGRARKRIRSDIIESMLPNAPIVPSRTLAILDTARSRIYVDTASPSTAEAVVSEVRRALGSFPALWLNAEVAPRSVLTGWLAGEELGDGVSLGDRAELHEPTDNGSKVKLEGIDLLGDEVRHHLEAGRQAVRLELAFEDHVSLVIGEDLVLRRIALLDGAMNQLESEERDDIKAELDARTALFLGEIRRVLAYLDVALRITDPLNPVTSTG